MSMSDSTQLSDDVIAHVTVSVDAPFVRAELSDTGKVRLYIGGIALSMSPGDAARAAASLATVASTALVNKALKLVTE